MNDALNTKRPGARKAWLPLFTEPLQHKLDEGNTCCTARELVQESRKEGNVKERLAM